MILDLLQDRRREFLLSLRMLRSNPLSVAGLIIALSFLGSAAIITIFGYSILPYNPDAINLNIAYLPPSLKHFLGTDQFGRDVFSRILAATPIDAEIALVIVAVAALVGVVIGSIAGYFGGKVDEVLMRMTDLFLAFPLLVLAIAVAVALGPGVDHVIEANLIVWWAIYSRLARAGALSIRESQFVEAAHVAGLSHLSIIRRHIIPNNISPLIVYATLDIGNVILFASVLSYLGLGAQPPQAEWGRMVNDGQTYLATTWWISIMPGVAILIVALGFNLLGDALRDTLDPRFRK